MSSQKARNDIFQKQNSQQFLNMLAAQRYLYSRGKKVDTGLLIFNILAPVVSILLLVLFPVQAPLLILGIAGGLTLVVTLGFKWRVRKFRKKAAWIQETFDTSLLGIPWNKSFTQEKLSGEDIERLAIRLENQEDLKDWYSDYSLEEFHVASLKCQMENLYWDGKQRAQYARFLLGGGIAVIVILGVLLYPFHPLLFLLPFVGLIYFIAVAYISHLTVSWSLKDQYFDAKYEASHPEKTPLQEWGKWQRTLQDLIFQKRQRAGLVPDWFYNWFRKGIHQVYQYESGQGVILIETRRLGIFSKSKIEKAAQNFEEAFASVDHFSKSVISKLEATDAREISLEMGVKVSGDLGAVIAKAQGEGQIKVTVKWSKEVKPSAENTSQIDQKP